VDEQLAMQVVAAIYGRRLTRPLVGAAPDATPGGRGAHSDMADPVHFSVPAAASAGHAAERGKGLSRLAELPIADSVRFRAFGGRRDPHPGDD
jgi:hypothetical protein